MISRPRVQNKLLAELDPSMDVSQTAEVRRTIEELFETILAEENIVLSRPERRRLFEQIVAEILGLGPLEPLLADETITEIMVNGAKNIYIERRGKITPRAGHLRERRPPDAHHRPHRRAARPPHRRIQPVRRCPPAGRLPRQRRHPAHLAGRPGPDHP